MADPMDIERGSDFSYRSGVGRSLAYRSALSGLRRGYKRRYGYARPAKYYGGIQKRRKLFSPRVGRNAELKVVDQVYTAVTIGDTWAGGEYDPVGGVLCIGACVQGSSETQRDGGKIVVKSIQIQGTVSRGKAVAQATGRDGNIIQVALVMDCQTNGAQLSAEEVYSVTDPEVPGRRVIANTSRFKVLRSQQFDINDQCSFNDAAATGTISGLIKTFNWYVKLSQVVNFVAGAGAGTIADFRDVSFHIIAAAKTGADCTLAYNARTRFVG